MLVRDMKINELFTDVITEDLNYEFKAKLNNDNPLKWAKTMIAFANGETNDKNNSKTLN